MVSKAELNKTEQVCLEWIKKEHNIEDKDIMRMYLKSPDFFLKNGLSYECKKLYGNSILLRTKQFKTLKKNNAIIVVFRITDTEPIFKIPSSEINPGDDWKGLKINWIYNDNTVAVHTKISNDVNEFIENFKYKNKIKGKSNAIMELIKISKGIYEEKIPSVKYEKDGTRREVLVDLTEDVRLFVEYWKIKNDFRGKGDAINHMIKTLISSNRNEVVKNIVKEYIKAKEDKK